MPHFVGHHVKLFITNLKRGSIIIPTLEKEILRLSHVLSVTKVVAAIRIHTLSAELGIKPVAGEPLWKLRRFCLGTCQSVL